MIELPASIDRHAVIDRLLRYSAAQTFPCFRLKRGSLHAAEAVGTLQVGRLRLNILPKSDGGGDERDKRFLMNLLHAAGYMADQASLMSAAVSTTSLDPLEALLLQTALEILNNLHDGAPRRYEQQAAESVTVRGRIDFGRLSRRVHASDIRLPVRYSPLSAANVLSRTIWWVAETLHSMARHAETRRLLQEVLSRMACTDGNRVTRNEVFGIVLRRYEMRWARLLGLAKLMADERFIDPTFAGRADAFGMLFPLQHLFERVLRHALADAGRDLGLTASHRSEAMHMLHDTSNSGFLRLRPDYVVSRNGTAVLLGDAKWKRLHETERAFGLERNDIYQLNAYLTRYAVQRAAVFVPRMPWMPARWQWHFLIPPDNRELHILPVDIEALVSRTASTRAAARADLVAALNNVAGGGGTS